jgi:GxxExxY protein
MLYEELTYKIRGAFYEVYNTLGPGFKEEIYHRALAKEFRLAEKLDIRRRVYETARNPRQSANKESAAIRD